MKKIFFVILALSVAISMYTVAYASDISHINDAKTADELIHVLNAEFPEFATDIEGIFYSKPVFARLTNSDYKDYEEFKSAYNAEITTEKSRPSAELTVNGEKAVQLSNGTVCVNIRNSISADATVYGVIYENSRMYAVTQTLPENAVLNFGELSFNSQNTYKFDTVSTDSNFRVCDEWLYEETKEDVNNIYVSESGNDENDGMTPETAVNTIQRAKEIVNSIKNNVSGDITVNIASGNYYITEPISFSPADSGNNGQTIRYIGDADGKTVINGGSKSIRSWSMVSNRIYRSRQSYPDIREFYVNGMPAKRAAYDNRIEAVSADSEGIIVNNSDLNSEYLKNPIGSELIFDILWTRQRMLVKGVKALPNSRTKLLLEKPWNSKFIETGGTGLTFPCSTDSYSKDVKYFKVEGSYQYLDSDGEFFYENGYLYYKFCRDDDILKTSFTIPISEGLLKIEGNSVNDTVKNLSFSNLNFENGTCLFNSNYSVFTGQAEYLDATEYSSILNPPENHDLIIPAQINVQYASDINFDNITVKNCSTTALRFAEGANDCGVTNSKFQNLGGAAVSVSNTGLNKHCFKNLYEKTPKRINIYNNMISNVSKQYASCPAVAIYHAQSVNLESNTIENCGYSGISVGWGWGAEWLSNQYSGFHTIKKNHVSNAVNILQDGAPIYTLGIFPNGAAIDSNYFGFSYEKPSPYGYHGAIYCDEGTSNCTFTNNVTEKCRRWLYARAGVNLSNIKVDNNYSDTTTSDIDTANVKVTNQTYNTTCDAAKKIKSEAGAK